MSLSKYLPLPLTGCVHLVLSALTALPALAASWTPLNNLMPNSVSSTMMLLTDGTIMVQGGGARWFRLTPDISGSYVNGSWTALAPMSTPRLDFASQVLPSGKVLVLGGEYAGPTLPYYFVGTGEVYDPASNRWSPIAPFPSRPGCNILNVFGATLTRNSPVVTGMISTESFQPGWTVVGTGIPADTTILSVDSNTQLHLSQNATANGAVGLQFAVQSTGNTTRNSAIITGIPSTAGLQLEWDVFGNGIPAGVIITSIDSPTQIHISSRATAAGSAVALTFGVEHRPSSCLGDAPSILLPGGKILTGNIIDNSTYLYDIATDTWTFAANKVYDDSSEEAGFAALSDGRVLVYDIFKSIDQNTGYAELYNPASNSWTSISPADGGAHGVLPVLSASPTTELGPNLRLQDDRILQIGGNGSTALYTPSTNTWAAGPPVMGTLNGLPFLFSSDDAPGVMLPNGHVMFGADAGLGVTSTGNTTSGSAVIKRIPSTALFQVGWAVTGDGIPDNTTISSVDSVTQVTLSASATATATGVSLTFGGGYASPAELFDFDPAAGTIGPVLPAIPDSNLTTVGGYVLLMLMLPNGQVLLADGTNQLWVYTPDGAAKPSVQPAITSVVSNGGGLYTLTGTQLNGPSAGSSYGDESQSVENYPIIRLVSPSGNVYYAKTTNWSLMGVGTGSTPETVNFTLNPAMPLGTYSLIVSCSGISSNPTSFSFQGTFTLSGTTASFGSAGGTGSVSVTASPSTAIWTATSNASWISIVSGGSGTGDGAVGYSVTGNNSVNPRTGTLTIAGQSFTVTQSGAAPVYGISPTTSTFGSAGGTGSVTVTATPPDAPWTASSNSGFLTLTSSASGMGIGTVSYSIAANNTGASRTGTLTIAGHTLTVTQTAVGVCSFAINPPTTSVGSGAGSTGVSLTGSFVVVPSSCSASDTWTAVSNSPRLVITSAATGNGAAAGTITWSMFTNSTTLSRSAQISVAGQTFTVTQVGTTENQAQRVVRALYQTILGREPDSGGFAFWTGAGAPRDSSSGAVLFSQMADGFYTSPEFGNSGWLVLNIYQTVTGALPAFSQWLSSVGQLRSLTLTAAQLTNNVSSALSPTALVQAAYQNGFGRPPTASELNTNVASLNSGQTRIDFLNQVIFRSGEFTSRTNGTLVQALFFTILVRDPDAGGFNFWLSQLNPPNGQSGIYYLYNPQPVTSAYTFKLAVIGQAAPPNPNLLGFLGSPEFQGLIQ